MSRAGVHILGAYWTTAGPVEIGTGREWSLFGWAQRCAEAARAGMSGLGIWHTDLVHLLETMSLAEIRQVFDDHGLESMEVEFLNDWFVPRGDPRREESDRQRALLFEAAAALRAHHIKVGNLKGTPAEHGQLTEAFGELCADAANHTEALITYELLPNDATVTGVGSVVALARGADAPNGGIAFDTWHLGKLGVEAAELHVVPPQYLHYVELSDGLVANMPSMGVETTRFRRLPGEGEFDVRGYVTAFTELGYRGPWGVEVLSDALRALPIEEMYRRTVETTTAQFDAPAEAGRRGGDS